MARSALIGLVAVAISICMTDAGADTLIVEGLDTARSTATQRPARGMTMQKVEATWGQPEQRQAAIGDPPITRWEYDDFVVYFEYSRVIHAVRKL